MYEIIADVWPVLLLAVIFATYHITVIRRTQEKKPVNQEETDDFTAMRVEIARLRNKGVADAATIATLTAASDPAAMQALKDQNSALTGQVSDLTERLTRADEKTNALSAQVETLTNQALADSADRTAVDAEMKRIVTELQAVGKPDAPAATA